MNKEKEPNKTNEAIIQLSLDMINIKNQISNLN